MHVFGSDDRTIDLHTHTTSSDGDHTPSELVKEAAALGLTAIAVTDHDTTAGLEEAVAAGRRMGVEVIPGIELSAEFSRGQCHLLGFFIDPDHSELVRRLQEVRDNRSTRNGRIIGKLQRLGFDITLDDVAALAGSDVVARPHFARAMVNRGIVSEMQEAFDVYLAKGAKAYVERDRLTQQESIDLVHAAGGLIILAHPNNMKRDPAETETEIRRLKEMGLDGIEARYSQHTPEHTEHYLALAERLNLLTSGGSDFHGPTVKPAIALGRVEGGNPAPRDVLERLKAAISVPVGAL